jgi:predicted RNA-binding Zn ribbon-like protein
MGSAIAAGKSVAKADEKAFSGAAADTYARLKFSVSRHAAHWEWDAGASDLRLPIWLICRSAVEVFLRVPFPRIKECPACGWLFLDRSKNMARRWCSMATCGSIDKSLRYYYRRRGNVRKHRS